MIIFQEALSRRTAADDRSGVVVLNEVVDSVPVNARTAGTTFQMMQQSGRRNEMTLTLVTGNAREITERTVFQRIQVLLQIDLLGKYSLTNVATMNTSETKNPLWVNGSMVLHHNVLVQRRLAKKVLVAYLACHLLMDLIIEMLIKSTLTDEVLLTVTASKLGDVGGLEVLDAVDSHSKTISHS